MADRIGKPISQRQLRVGEMIKQSLSMIFIRNEAKVPNLETNTITVTEVRMSQDLKIAKAYVLPLGGKNAEEIIQILKDYSFMIRKILSQKVNMKFLPKLIFRKDEGLAGKRLWRSGAAPRPSNHPSRDLAHQAKKSNPSHLLGIHDSGAVPDRSLAGCGSGQSTCLAAAGGFHPHFSKFKLYCSCRHRSFITSTRFERS